MGTTTGQWDLPDGSANTRGPRGPTVTRPGAPLVKCQMPTWFAFAVLLARLFVFRGRELGGLGSGRPEAGLTQRCFVSTELQVRNRRKTTPTPRVGRVPSASEQNREPRVTSNWVLLSKGNDFCGEVGIFTTTSPEGSQRSHVSRFILVTECRAGRGRCTPFAQLTPTAAFRSLRDTDAPGRGD